MIVMSLRNGSSGARLLGDKSNARPTSAGAHMFFLMPKAVLPAEPCTISMAAKRILPRAACAEARAGTMASRSEEHTSELQSQSNLVCRLLLEKKKKNQ